MNHYKDHHFIGKKQCNCSNYTIPQVTSASFQKASFTITVDVVRKQFSPSINFFCKTTFLKANNSRIIPTNTIHWS